MRLPLDPERLDRYLAEIERRSEQGSALLGAAGGPYAEGARDAFARAAEWLAELRHRLALDVARERFAGAEEGA